MRKIFVFWVLLVVILIAGIAIVIFSQMSLNKEEKVLAVPKLPDDAMPGVPVKIDTSDLQAPSPLDIDALKAPKGPMRPELLTPPVAQPILPVAPSQPSVQSIPGTAPPPAMPEIPQLPQLPPTGR